MPRGLICFNPDKEPIEYNLVNINVVEDEPAPPPQAEVHEPKEEVHAEPEPHNENNQLFREVKDEVPSSQREPKNPIPKVDLMEYFKF